MEQGGIKRKRGGTNNRDQPGPSKNPANIKTVESGMSQDINEEDAIDERITDLTKELENVPTELTISLLHKYNCVKDSAQVVLGVLADLQNVSTKQVHEELGLPVEEDSS